MPFPLALHGRHPCMPTALGGLRKAHMTLWIRSSAAQGFSALLPQFPDLGKFPGQSRA